MDKVINGEPVGGVKVNSFIDSLMLKNGAVCIDSWMLKAFDIKRLAPTDKDRRIITGIIKLIADKLKLKTYEVQACLWCYAKKELNGSVHKKYHSFAHYISFKITTQETL